MKLITQPSTTSTVLRFVALALLAVSLTACEEDARTRYAYTINLPDGFSAAAEIPTVPGEALESYRAAPAVGTASLTVFRTSQLSRTNADQLLVERRNLIATLPETEVHTARVTEIDGQSAVLLESTAPGDGTSHAPTALGAPKPDAGFVPTRRIWIAIPRDGSLGTLELIFHCPEDQLAKLRPVWESLLSSVDA